MQTISAIITKIKSTDESIAIYDTLSFFIMDTALKLGLNEINIIEIDDICGTDEEIKQNIKNILNVSDVFKEDYLIYSSASISELEQQQSTVTFAMGAEIIERKIRILKDLGFEDIGKGNFEDKLPFIYSNELGEKFLSLLKEMEDNE